MVTLGSSAWPRRWQKGHARQGQSERGDLHQLGSERSDSQELPLSCSSPRQTRALLPGARLPCLPSSHKSPTWHCVIHPNLCTSQGGVVTASCPAGGGRRPNKMPAASCCSGTPQSHSSPSREHPGSQKISGARTRRVIALCPLVPADSQDLKHTTADSSGLNHTRWNAEDLSSVTILHLLSEQKHFK